MLASARKSSPACPTVGTLKWAERERGSVRSSASLDKKSRRLPIPPPWEQTASVWGHINSDYTLAYAHTHTHPPRSKATPLYFDLKNGRQEEYTVGHPLSNETREILFCFLSKIQFTNWTAQLLQYFPTALEICCKIISKISHLRGCPTLQKVCLRSHCAIILGIEAVKVSW